MYIESTRDVFAKNDFIIINVVSPIRHKNNTNLLKYIWEIKTMLGIDPILKWEIIKNVVNIRWVIDFAHCLWQRN